MEILIVCDGKSRPKWTQLWLISAVEGGIDVWAHVEVTLRFLTRERPVIIRPAHRFFTGRRGVMIVARSDSKWVQEFVHDPGSGHERWR